VSTTLGKQLETIGKAETAKKNLTTKEALPSVIYRTLSNDFAECRLTLGKQK
jgi:hypothetical protein